MDHNLHEVPPTRVTYQQLQSLTRHGPCTQNSNGFEGVDYNSLLTAWAVAIKPTVDEPSPGYFYWLGGDRIQYQPLKAQEDSS